MLYRNEQSETNILKALDVYRKIIVMNSNSTSSKVYISALYEYSSMLESVADNLDDENLYDVSFYLLMKAAELGHSTAQHELAAAYNTGIYGGLVPVDPARALLLEYMSALSGNAEAHMGMGFKYLHGIGVKASCERSLIHYEYAANEAIRLMSSNDANMYDSSTLYEYRNGLPLHAEFSRLTDVLTSTGGIEVNKKGAEFDPDLIAFYSKLAEEGDASAAFNLGVVYLYGTRLVDSDMFQCYYYLNQAAKNSLSNVIKGPKGYYGHTAASAVLGGEFYEDHPYGSPVDNSYVIQARGLLGYILMKGEFFSESSYHNEEAMLTGKTTSGRAELFDYILHTLNIDYSDMIVMIKYGAYKNDANAVAALGYWNMIGSKCSDTIMKDGNSACGDHHEYASDVDVPANSTIALEYFNYIVSK